MVICDKDDSKIRIEILLLLLTVLVIIGLFYIIRIGLRLSSLYWFNFQNKIIQ